MSEENITCVNCGKLTKKNSKYCYHCGSSLEKEPQISMQETQEKLSATLDTGSISDGSIPMGKKLNFRIGDLSAGYKVLAFFIIVSIIDLFGSFVFVAAFKLPLDTYFMIFVGFYIFFMIFVGLIWGAATSVDFANELLKGCGAIFGIILLLMILIPLYVIYALPGIIDSLDFSSPALEEIGQRITEGISNAFENFFRSIFQGIGDNIKSSWDDAFEDVEVPGFEPFLFGGIFAIIAFVIIYNYHRKAKRTNIIN